MCVVICTRKYKDKNFMQTFKYLLKMIVSPCCVVNVAASNGRCGSNAREMGMVYYWCILGKSVMSGDLLRVLDWMSRDVLPGVQKLM